MRSFVQRNQVVLIGIYAIGNESAERFRNWFKLVMQIYRVDQQEPEISPQKKIENVTEL